MNTLFRLGKEIGKYRGYYVAAIMSLILATAVSLAAPLFVSEMVGVVETGLDAEGLKYIGILAGVLGGLYLFKAVLKFVHSYTAHIAAWNLVNGLRVRLYGHITNLDIGFFYNNKTGNLMSTVINDTANFEMLYAHNIPDLINNAVTFVGVTAVLAAINYKLALLTAIPLPFLFVFGWLYVKRIRPNFRKAQGAVAGLNTRLQDNFSGFREIKAFGQEDRECLNVKNDAATHTTAILKALKKSALFHPSVQFLTSMGTVIVVGIGGILAFGGELGVTDIVVFLLYLGLYYAPVENIARLLEDTQLAYASAERVFSILDTESQIKDAENAVDLENVRGEIEFRNVSFDYGNGDVLKNISFKVKQGETLAVVGATGVGKTTLINLIPRFYEPKSGSVYIDGKDIATVSLKSLRNAVSEVMQDTFLFNATIADNIRYAKPNAGDAEVVNAAKAAVIHEDILRMPNGYETVVGERGVLLSGGQKQRISIARAILKDSPVIILDEATASVDNETENKIREAIDAISGSRTVIAIAHRLTTIKNADKIMVMDDGKIAEVGTHDELIAKHGVYYSLYNGAGAN